MLDGDFRDFADLGETTRHCPRVCCMSATIQPDLLSDLAGKFGRDGFSASISMSPQRSTLSLVLKVTSDTRSFITVDLLSQSPGERAIIFCLFKNNVPHVANYVQSACRDRCVFQCISGKAADFAAFNRSESAIMVCYTLYTSSLASFLLRIEHSSYAPIQPMQHKITVRRTDDGKDWFKKCI